MAELATIARPYAEALYKAVQADLETAAVWLNELAAIVDDDTLGSLPTTLKQPTHKCSILSLV